MPWTVDDPPAVAKNWTAEERRRCVAAANQALTDGKAEEQAIFACIGAAGRARKAIDPLSALIDHAWRDIKAAAAHTGHVGPGGPHRGHGGSGSRRRAPSGGPSGGGGGGGEGTAKPGPKKPKTETLTLPDGTKRNAEVIQHGDTRILVPTDLDSKRQRLKADDIARYLDQVPPEHRSVIKEIELLDVPYTEGSRVYRNTTATFDLDTKRVSVYRNDRFSKDEVEKHLSRTVRHETAHALEDQMPPQFLKDWKRAARKDGAHITDYAKTDIHEDVAETIAFHWSGDRNDRRTVEMFFPERAKVLAKYGIKPGG